MEHSWVRSPTQFNRSVVVEKKKKEERKDTIRGWLLYSTRVWARGAARYYIWESYTTWSGEA